MNNMKNLHDSLLAGTNEILVDPELGRKALIPLQRMLDFKARQ